MKVVLLVAVLAALSLPVAAGAGLTFTPDKGTKASAATILTAPPGPTRSVTCGGTCIGGGTPGCGTITDQRGDGYGNMMKVVYHACWTLSAVLNNYGHLETYPCWGFCSVANINYDYEFQYGHRSQVKFFTIGIDRLSFSSTLTGGVCVNKYGNFWPC